MTVSRVPHLRPAVAEGAEEVAAVGLALRPLAAEAALVEAAAVAVRHDHRTTGERSNRTAAADRYYSQAGPAHRVHGQTRALDRRQKCSSHKRRLRARCPT